MSIMHEKVGINDRISEFSESNQKDQKDISFEDALNELERIVKALENNEIGLENAVKYYEKASQLHEFCQKKLESAKLKVNSIIQKDGKIEGSNTSDLEELYGG